MAHISLLKRMTGSIPEGTTMNKLLLILLLTMGADNGKEISSTEVLQVAEKSQKSPSLNFNTYTGLLVKRELVDGEDTGYQYIEFKYRETPRAIYLRFLKPDSLKDREVLYKGGDELIVKRGGRRNASMTLTITTDSPLAVEGNRYSIKEMGLSFLSKKLVEGLKREVVMPGTKIKVFENAKIDGRPVTLYRMFHFIPHPDAQCTTAQLAIDKEMNIPIYYRSNDENGYAIEEYTFRNINLNAKLTDEDFNENNPAYGFNIKTP